MQVRSDTDAVIDAAGPLNALEAERYVEELRSFSFEEMGGPRWMDQHEWLQLLNMQAHVNASQQRDEFVVEALVLHEKLPLLVRELVACELWKLNVYPILKEFLATQQSVKGYLLLYHEAVLANLLEAALYHPSASEATGELLGELCDYCHRKMVWLMQPQCFPPPRPADKAELKAQILQESAEGYLDAQAAAIGMSAALCALSIVRFLTERLAQLPLAVASKLLDEYDVLMLLAPLLEHKPWEHREPDGSLRRFVQGQWVRASDAEARKMAKCEAQAWLSVYNMMAEPEVRRKYTINSYRKNQLLTLRAQLNETVVDQIPLLVELQRALDELQFIQAASNADAKPAYVFETEPQLRAALTRGVDWQKVAAAQRDGVLNESEEEKRRAAQKLAALYDADGLEDMIETGAGSGAGGEGAKMAYFIEFALLDAEGNQVAALSAQSEPEAELGPQTPFLLSNDAKRTLLPADVCATGSFSAGLNGGEEPKPWTSSGRLGLSEEKKKQWAQIGFDQHTLRVQLHFLRAEDMSGFHLIHCRVTPPEKLALEISFAHNDANPVVVRAHGRGVEPQTPFAVAAEDFSVRVPRLCRARARLRCGEEMYETEESAMQLSSAEQMVWRQLGKLPTELRVQLKLAPVPGGYMVTTVRVTPPSFMRQQQPPPQVEQTQTPAAPSPERVEAEAALPPSKGTSVQGLKTDDRADEKPCAAVAEPELAVPAADASAASANELQRNEDVRAAEAEVSEAMSAMEVAEEEAAAAARRAAAAGAKAAELAAALEADADDDDSRIKDVTEEAEAAAAAAEAAKAAKSEAERSTRKLRAAETRVTESKEKFCVVQAEALAQGVATARGSASPRSSAPSADGEGDFVASSSFGGARAGFAFRLGDRGLGYYRDMESEPQLKLVKAAAADSSSEASMVRTVAEKKEEADKFFAAGDVRAALDAYSALLDGPVDVTQLRSSLLANRAACHLALRQLEECAADCTAALEAEAVEVTGGAGAGEQRSQRVRVKLLLRRTEALRGLGRFAEAEVELATAAAIAADEPVLGQTVEIARAELFAARSAVAPAGKSTPEHSVKMENEGRVVVLLVDLPGVKAQRELDVEVTDDRFQLQGGKFNLDLELPCKVDSSSAAAKFSTKTSRLKVSIPVAS